MRRRILLFVAGVFIAPLAFAQGPAPAVPASSPPGGSGPVSGTGSGKSGQADILVPRRSDVSSQDMMNQCRDYRERIQQIMLRIGKLQDQAKKAQDVVRLNCLVDKYQQARVDLTITDRAIFSMQEAQVRRDEPAITHEFSKITIVHQKAQILVGEAESCIGDDLTYLGSTEVKVVVDPGIPTDEDPAMPTLSRPYIDRPTAASPYK